jgi:hypothetical protein
MVEEEEGGDGGTYDASDGYMKLSLILSPASDLVTRHTSHLTPHTSHLTPHTSHLTPHTSHLTPHTSHLTPHTFCLNHLIKQMRQIGRCNRSEVPTIHVQNHYDKPAINK